MTQLAIGIDIGGTAIKAALVDLNTGIFASERVEVPTPLGAEPLAVAAAVQGVLNLLEAVDPTTPVGIALPAVVKRGYTLSAANISPAWIGLDAQSLFQDHLGRDVRIANDADVAGTAEVHFGAAKNVCGLVIVTTLGTGIGTALVYDGVLIPNSELGHLEYSDQPHAAEHYAAFSAVYRHHIDYTEWSARLQRYYTHLEALLSPDLIVIGGGGSLHIDKFLPHLSTRSPIVPARHRNSAGIYGAAALAITTR